MLYTRILPITIYRLLYRLFEDLSENVVIPLLGNINQYFYTWITKIHLRNFNSIRCLFEKI